MCNDYENSPYDMYIMKPIEIYNDGGENAQGNVKLMFTSDMKVYKIYLRNSKSVPYLSIPFIIQ